MTEKLPNGIQLNISPDVFPIGTDSLLLIDFIGKPKGKIADLGSGSGIVGFSVIDSVSHCLFVDISPESVSSVETTAKDNNIQNVSAVISDVSALPKSLYGQFDSVLFNPPYYSDGKRNEAEKKAVARHGDVMQFVKAASLLLKNGGNIYCCYPAEMVFELSDVFRKNGMEIKRLQFVRKNASSKPYLALIQGKKQSKPGCIIEKDVIPSEKA